MCIFLFPFFLEGVEVLGGEKVVLKWWMVEKKASLLG